MRFDAHRDDPEFGYRFLVDEARAVGLSMADRTAWRICSSTGWWSAFGKKRGPNGKKAGPPVHDDLVRRDFTATAPNRLWPADITEHRTTEGKLYLCAVKDVRSNRIVGYSIDSRMRSRLAVAALTNAVALRGEIVGCVVHTDRGQPGCVTTTVTYSCSRPEHVRVPGRAALPCAARRVVIRAVAATLRPRVNVRPNPTSISGRRIAHHPASHISTADRRSKIRCADTPPPAIAAAGADASDTDGRPDDEAGGTARFQLAMLREHLAADRPPPAAPDPPG
ncbi:DDE-type integrase/transposase/recombinase [Saccharothrix sp. 6-C]|uniref:DDE-type integrase/transposase/recombinase n=1 Tax=Saccharothrix sp. 6-C TaxID=2781735 RepID=UPI0019178C77|nr:DDE-type integrase/transposase/recombinase [Saccharothrix sp. 6-C]QQQ78704.1 DDE-type integrase/transposase/recombinase [Saccharothrix sp. 6-C]